MEDEIKNREINDTQYKEVEINKMIINGKEQAGNIINAEDTRGKQEINVTVYPRSMPQVQKDGGRNNRFYELLQKVLFHNKRS